MHMHIDVLEYECSEKQAHDLIIVIFVIPPCGPGLCLENCTFLPV